MWCVFIMDSWCCYFSFPLCLFKTCLIIWNIIEHDTIQASMSLFPLLIWVCVMVTADRKQGRMDVLRRLVILLFLIDSEVCEGLMGCVIPADFMGLPWGLLPEYVLREDFRSHANQTPKPPRLPPFGMKEHSFYSELLLDVEAPNPI